MKELNISKLTKSCISDAIMEYYFIPVSVSSEMYSEYTLLPCTLLSL